MPRRNKPPNVRTTRDGGAALRCGGVSPHLVDRPGFRDGRRPRTHRPQQSALPV